MINQVETENMELKERWEQLLADNPRTRIRAAANQLGVSELELLKLNTGKTVTRLQPEFKTFLEETEKLGYVMALTRNESVVHERKGVYANFSYNPHASLFVNEDIDLRLFPASWKYLYAEENEQKGVVKRSFQIFDKNGTAVHKIYLTPKSDVEAYKAIKEQLIAENQNEVQPIEPLVEQENEKPLPSAEELEKFKDEWRNLKDTHHFFGLINKYKLSRIQALENAPEEYYASKIDNNSLRKALELASESNAPIMVFVGNKGAIQIHTGEVNNIVEYGTWINVMDPEFNLHANMEDIDQSWIVRKPTEDGIVTSLEVFDKEENLIVTLFGKRKPGIPEMKEWQELIEKL